MKKSMILILAALTVLMLAACGGEAKEVSQTPEAVILDISPESRSILVEDVENERIFSGGTWVDCEEAPVYREGDSASEISFLDLEPGDRIRLSLSEKARKALGKGETEISALQVEILN